KRSPSELRDHQLRCKVDCDSIWLKNVACPTIALSFMTNNAIVQRLWNLCHILRDDGITYHQYVTELTYLLFLKMMQERGEKFEKQIPKGPRWKDLEAMEVSEQHTFLKKRLIELGNKPTGRVEAIFAGAQSNLTQPKTPARLFKYIDEIDWYSAQKEGL